LRKNFFRTTSTTSETCSAGAAPTGIFARWDQKKRRVLERWYDFESKATERAVREWCELNEIEVAD
jgi:hypothetical protein